MGCLVDTPEAVSSAAQEEARDTSYRELSRGQNQFNVYEVRLLLHLLFRNLVDTFMTG